GDDAGRPRAQVLLIGSPRHPPHRDAQGWGGGDRQPRAREGGQEQGRAGVRAFRLCSSVPLHIRRIETLKDGVEAIGNRVRVKVVKNKVAPPFKQAEFDIIYGEGISWEGTVLEVGLEKKLVQKSGSYFSYGDERLGQGRQNATAFLKEHPDVC